MSSRMNKYYDEYEEQNSRYKKNEQLYKEINKSELNHYNVKSNATILGDNEEQIDVEEIRKLLDNKYKEIPSRKSIRIEQENDLFEEKEITKEYDINVILEKAREQKVDNYQEERFKKIHDTQFDILKNLDVNKNVNDEDNDENLGDNLKNLINTISINEKMNSKNDALDLLEELKGSDNTEVLEGLKEEVEKESKSITDTQMIESFYTTNNKFKDQDFEDFSKSLESNNIAFKIIITIIIVVFLAGILLMVKTIIS